MMLEQLKRRLTGRLLSTKLSARGPALASGFSGNPKYQEAANFLDDVIVRLRRLKCDANADITPSRPPVEWLSRERMSDRIGLLLNEAQYTSLKTKLDVIISSPLLYDEKTNINPTTTAQIIEVVKCFAKEDSLSLDANGHFMDPRRVTARIDKNGWIRATGTRKTAVANVILKPLSGDTPQENTVNNRPLHRYFKLFRDLHAVAWPLKLTDRLGKYSLMATCRGGGPSGQSGAMRLAISKALAKAEPNLYDVLSSHGLLIRDTRMVERKKPGQEKARRKFAWVKR